MVYPSHERISFRINCAEFAYKQYVPEDEDQRMERLDRNGHRLSC